MTRRRSLRRGARGPKCCQVLCALAFLSVPEAGVTQDRFVPKESLPYGIHDVGGCKIITIRRTDRPSDRIAQQCRARPTPGNRLGKSWHDYYSSVESFVRSALDLAEQHVGGYTYSLLKPNTQIVLYSEPYPNAMIYASATEIVLFINDGLVDLIEGTVASMSMKTVPVQVEPFRHAPGVSYDQWLEAMRTPRYLWGDRGIRAGPDPIDARGANVAWFYNTRAQATALYEFIFAHEMAHLKAGDRLAEPDLLLERERDLEALRAMENAPLEGYGDVVAVSVASLMLAMWYHEKYWESEIRKAGYVVFDGARPLLHTRNWKARGRAILEQWRAMEGGVSTRAKQSAYDRLTQWYALRDPMQEDSSTQELAAGVRVQEVDVINSGDLDGAVQYGYRVTNTTRAPVRVVVEVQSRAYLRDGGLPVSVLAPFDWEEGRPYEVVDDSLHELTLDGGQTREISGQVWGLSSTWVYGRVKWRIVSASEN